MVVVPAANGDGSALSQLLSAQCPGATPLNLDNVDLPGYIAGWYTSLDADESRRGFEPYQYTTAVHELLHQFSALDESTWTTTTPRSRAG